VIVHWESIRHQWQALTLALIASTLITLAITALTMLGVQRMMGRRRNGAGG
jgi:putative effector of murein hydrolase LrgA (UPF0299 family)